MNSEEQQPAAGSQESAARGQEPAAAGSVFDRTQRLIRAIEFAQAVHCDHVDKAGESYLWHVLRVGISLFPDVDAAVTGILHDVLEDSPWTVADLRATGLADPVLEALILLCRTADQTYEQYIWLLSRNPLARKVKLADIADNLDPGRLLRARAAGHDMDPLVERYRKARELLLFAERMSPR